MTHSKREPHKRVSKYYAPLFGEKNVNKYTPKHAVWAETVCKSHVDFLKVGIHKDKSFLYSQ